MNLLYSLQHAQFGPHRAEILIMHRQGMGVEVLGWSMAENYLERRKNFDYNTTMIMVKKKVYLQFYGDLKSLVC